MRRKQPAIDLKALASVGDKPKSVTTVEGQPLVPGLLARRRGDKLVWLMRYRAGKVQRELVLGHLPPDGGAKFGNYALANTAVNGGDFAAALRTSKGVKEGIPLTHLAAVASRARAMIENGADPVADRQAAKFKEQRANADHNFREYAEQFLAEGVKKRGKPMRPTTLREYRRALMVYAAPLHGRSVKEIDREEIADLIISVKAKHGAVTATRMRAALSRFFDWLIGRGKVQFGNPVSHTPIYVSEPRDRVLSDAELRALWEATADGSDFSDIIRLLLLTGARTDEIGGMHSDELNGQGEWLLPRERAKNGRDLLLPLPRQAREIVARRATGGYLFGQRPGRPFQGWWKAKKRLDAVLGFSRPWQLRDLRRTVETRLASVGVPQEHINRLLNHAQGPITATYNRYGFRAEKAAALQRWADELDRIVGNPPPENVVRLPHAS